MKIHNPFLLLPHDVHGVTIRLNLCTQVPTSFTKSLNSSHSDAEVDIRRSSSAGLRLGWVRLNGAAIASCRS